MDLLSDPRFPFPRHPISLAYQIALPLMAIFTIAKLMGHKSIAMSERYSHLSPDHKRQAIANLEKAMTEKRSAIVSPGQKGT